MAPIIRIIVRVGYRGSRRLIVINLGKNPVSGGIPLIDIIMRGMMMYNIFILEHIFCS